jgi:hypothetical protein
MERETSTKNDEIWVNADSKQKSSIQLIKKKYSIHQDLTDSVAKLQKSPSHTPDTVRTPCLSPTLTPRCVYAWVLRCRALTAAVSVIWFGLGRKGGAAPTACRWRTRCSPARPQRRPATPATSSLTRSCAGEAAAFGSLLELFQLCNVH